MSVEVEETAGARVTYQVEAVNQFYFIKDAGAPLLDNLTSLGRFNQSFTLDVTLRPGAKATIENRSEKPKVLATFLLIDVYDAVNETAFSWPAEYGCLFYRAFPGAQDGMLAHWDYSEKAPKGVVAIDSGKASTAMIIADTWGTHKTRGTTDGVPVLDPRDPWTEVLRKKNNIDPYVGIQIWCEAQAEDARRRGERKVESKAQIAAEADMGPTKEIKGESKALGQDVSSGKSSS